MGGGAFGKWSDSPVMKITLIALSSLKETYLKEAAGEYAKRLGGYCDLKVIEIKPARLPEKPSAGEIESALEREAKEIAAKIPPNTYVTALCIEGKQKTSPEFAAAISQNYNLGCGMTFLIGSSHGLAESIKQRCNERLSFSKMTFPHQLFRVMLLEQLYRAFQIINGGEYHK